LDLRLRCIATLWRRNNDGTLLAEARTGQEHMKEMMDAKQAKADASLKKIEEEMKANHAKMDGNRVADREHMQQMITKIESDREEMVPRMDAN
jgi:hypothetical protein